MRIRLNGIRPFGVRPSGKSEHSSKWDSSVWNETHRNILVPATTTHSHQLPRLRRFFHSLAAPEHRLPCSFEVPQALGMCLLSPVTLIKASNVQTVHSVTPLRNNHSLHSATQPCWVAGIESGRTLLDLQVSSRFLRKRRFVKLELRCDAGSRGVTRKTG